MKKTAIILSLVLVLALSTAFAAGCDGKKDSKKESDDDITTELTTKPEELGSITWPSVGPASYIPEPKSGTGKITKDSSYYFSAKIGDTTKDDYAEYVGWCFDYGYDIDYENGETSYNAYNYYGVYVEVSYEGDNIMSIYVEAPEETTAEPEAASPEAEAPETQAPQTQEQAGSDTIRPEIKEAIDSYEAFIDEYCEFMNNYDSTDITLMVKYTEFVAKEAEMTRKFNAIKDDELTDAEEDYFIEVELRCAQKLNEAAVSMAN